MGSRAYRHDMATADAGLVLIAGGFVCNSSSDPALFLGPAGLSATKPNGVSSIVHASTGTYTVTFVDNFYACVAKSIHLEMGTPDGKIATFAGFTNLNASGTFTASIVTLSSGSAADIAAASNTNIVNFVFYFKKTSAV